MNRNYITRQLKEIESVRRRDLKSRIYEAQQRARKSPRLVMDQAQIDKLERRLEKLRKQVEADATKELHAELKKFDASYKDVLDMISWAITVKEHEAARAKAIAFIKANKAN